MRSRRLLFYLLLPFALILALIGFPLPVPPHQPAKPVQEQSDTLKRDV